MSMHRYVMDGISIFKAEFKVCCAEQLVHNQMLVRVDAGRCPFGVLVPFSFVEAKNV